jgi:hypothetical protein
LGNSTTKINLGKGVSLFPFQGVITIIGVFIIFSGNSFVLAYRADINECVAPESNNIVAGIALI